MDELKLNIQKFAEEEQPDTNDEAEILSLDEILEDDYYKSQFDRKMSKGIETAIANARTKWEKEAEQQKAEAVKLAEMDEVQKANYETEKYKKLYESEKKSNEVNNLRAETLRQASQRGIPSELLQHLKYEYEDADSINEILNSYEQVQKSMREKVIQEYSREQAPQVGERVTTTKPKSQMTYEELAKLPEYND